MRFVLYWQGGNNFIYDFMRYHEKHEIIIVLDYLHINFIVEKEAVMATCPTCKGKKSIRNDQESSPLIGIYETCGKCGGEGEINTRRCVHCGQFLTYYSNSSYGRNGWICPSSIGSSFIGFCSTLGDGPPWPPEISKGPC